MERILLSNILQFIISLSNIMQFIPNFTFPHTAVYSQFTIIYLLHNSTIHALRSEEFSAFSGFNIHICMYVCIYMYVLFYPKY